MYKDKAQSLQGLGQGLGWALDGKAKAISCKAKDLGFKAKAKNFGLEVKAKHH